MPHNSTIIGVDILPIRALPNVITIMGDIMKQSTANEIQGHLQTMKVDVVLHDGAPNVGGNSWAKDAYGQNELVIHALRLATKFLKPGGWFVTKVFRSQDYTAVLDGLRPFFQKTEATKPSSSRNASPEIFVVCRGYLAPKVIDPGSLDPTVVFSGEIRKPDQGTNSTDVPLSKQPQKMSANQFLKVNLKRKRSRSGYDDDAGMLLFKAGKVDDFVRSNDPISFFVQFNALEFEENSPFLGHPATTEETKELFSDLKVLGRSGFSRLLKWRKKVLKDLQEEENARHTEGKRGLEEEEEGEEALTAEEKIEKQIQDLQDRMAKERRKYKKQKHLLRQKMRKRQELNPHLNSEDSILDGADNEGLFSLGELLRDGQMDREELLRILNSSSMEDIDVEELEKLARAGDSDGEGEGDDSDNPIAGKYGVALSHEEYMGMMEQQLEDLHTLYRERRKKVKQRREKLGLDGEDAPGMRKRKTQKVDPDDSELSDSDVTAPVGNRRSVDSGEEEEGTTGSEGEEEMAETGRRELTLQDAARVNRWFARDIFASAQESLLGAENQKSSMRNSRPGASTADTTSSSDEEMQGDDGNDEAWEEEEGGEGAGAGAEMSDEEDGEEDEGPSIMDTWSDEDLTSDSEEEIIIKVVTPRKIPKLSGNHVTPRRNSPLSEPQEDKSALDEMDLPEIGLPNPKRERKLRGELVRSKARTARERRIQHQRKLKGLDEKPEKSNLEIVPQQNPRAAISLFNRHGKLRGGDSDMEDSQDDESDLTEYSSDTDAEAEVLALAQTMLRKKQRNEILDHSYNRYTFDDPDGLPDWFVEEEEQYNKPLLPITKEQVNAFKQQLRAINARPAKKIAEAKARNKMRTLKRWEKLKTQSEGIAAQSDLTEEEKLRQIAKLYERTPKKSVKRQKVYVVSRKHGASSGPRPPKGAQVVRVDRRMLADKRGEKAAEKRRQKGGRSKKKRSSVSYRRR